MGKQVEAEQEEAAVPQAKAEDVRELENIRTRAAIPESQNIHAPESIREPESMERSPWVPRFQGWGLEAWEGSD